MKKVNSSDLKNLLIKEFLAFSPKKQAEIIRKLPTREERILAVRDIIFPSDLYVTAGLLAPTLVAYAIAKEREHLQKEVLTALVQQPYFPKIWNAMAYIVYPSEAFEVIPENLLVDMFNRRVGELSMSWEKVEDIISIHDDDTVVAIAFGLGGRGEEDDDVKGLPAVYKKYERLHTAAEGPTEKWIMELFKIASIETKACLLASLKSKILTRKVMGLLATQFSGSESANHFAPIVVGNFGERKNDDNCFDIPLFARTYSDAIMKYKTSPQVVIEVISLFEGYRNIFPVIFNNIPLLTLKRIVALVPYFKDSLSFENKKLLSGNLGYADAKRLIGNESVPGTVAKKIKSFSPERKLQLLL